MKSWMPCFQREPHRIVGITILLYSLTFGIPSVSAADYFTELEIDEIRAAQEIDKRVSLLLEIAQVRLVHLGLIETEESIEETTSISTFDRIVVRILSREAAAEIEAIEEERGTIENELSQFSRTELLRGYHQALEETMDNIDDVYERNPIDIREPLESLQEFTEETIRLLRRFEAENEAEEIALEDAITQTEMALEGAESALEIVPKTLDQK